MTKQSWPIRVTALLIALLVGASVGYVTMKSFWASANAPVQASDSSGKQTSKSFAGKTAAEEFPPALTWFNTGGKKLSLKQLRGKIVLLDFWTYGCINCMHIIPDLKRLEEKHADTLVVIGVHSPKFEREKSDNGLENIIARYDLGHPVVNDRDFDIWRAYGTRAWPTLVLIDPAGNWVGALEGEGHYEVLDQVISGLETEFSERKQLSRMALGFEHSAMDQQSLLRFPGKVLADTAHNQIWIADSNHHRLVMTDTNGEVKKIVGSGMPGLQDGNCEKAQFSRPQGITLFDANTLIVADTDNHALRQVDIKACKVTTLIGDGKQHYLKFGVNFSGLNSPWDVLAVGDNVYIAMAGQHQIWSWNLKQQKLSLYIGSGREELKDGALKQAGMAQPSGLTTDGKYLYIADAEASAIRRAPLLGQKGEVETLVGEGLFEFGDVDGVGKKAKLQHALGVAYANNHLYIADTYNSKIKTLDLATLKVSTLIGSDGKLNEPGGLSVSGDKLYVVDTNNHNIDRFNLNGAREPFVVSTANTTRPD